MSAIERTHANCNPPEFYIRLWRASETNQTAPRFKSTFLPKPLDKPKPSGKKKGLNK